MTLYEALNKLKAGAKAAVRMSNPRRELRYEEGKIFVATAYPNDCMILEKNSYGPSWADVWADDWEVFS